MNVAMHIVPFGRRESTVVRSRPYGYVELIEKKALGAVV